MTDIEKRSLRRRARNLLGERLAYVEDIAKAVAAEQSATDELARAIQRAKQRQADARAVTNGAVAAAIEAGWTPADLRDLGFEIPASRLRKTPHRAGSGLVSATSTKTEAIPRAITGKTSSSVSVQQGPMRSLGEGAS